MPLTLDVDEPQTGSDFHGNGAWGASRAGIAKAVTESRENRTLPPEAQNDRVVVSANCINPATDDLDAVFAQLPRVQTRDSRGDERPGRIARNCSRPRWSRIQAALAPHQSHRH